jgi:hypothetical protein
MAQPLVPTCSKNVYQILKQPICDIDTGQAVCLPCGIRVAVKTCVLRKVQISSGLAFRKDLGTSVSVMMRISQILCPLFLVHLLAMDYVDLVLAK